MSELAVDTIGNLAGTAPPVVTGGEFVQARVNYDGTGTPAISDSANISSLTDNGTGDQTVNFSAAFPNTGYSFGSGLQVQVDTALVGPWTLAARTLTASSFRITSGGGGSFSVGDAKIISLQFVGDYA